MDTKRLPAIVIPSEAWDRFTEYAVSQDIRVSDAVRLALQEFLESRGVAISFAVDAWGGDRRKDDKPPQPE